MKIQELMQENCISLKLTASSKQTVIKELVDMLDKAGKLSDRPAFEQAVFDREKESTTGIGMDVAIPHGKSAGVKEPAIAFGKSVEGIDFESLDGKPAKLFFLIAVPESSSNLHLEVLKQLSRSLMHKEIREKLLNADSFAAIIETFE